MCGIAGIISVSYDEPIPRETLDAMTDTLVHRGFDASGYRLGNGVGLGHRRLSMVDLATGDPPLNEDGSAWVVFNGEILDYDALRLPLTSEGHVLAARADTGVIVHQHEEDGVACVERSLGMFAFAVGDDRKQQVLLARDRFGIKPLFSAESGRRLAFASEMRAISGCRLSRPLRGREVAGIDRHARPEGVVKAYCG